MEALLPGRLCQLGTWSVTDTHLSLQHLSISLTGMIYDSRLSQAFTFTPLRCSGWFIVLSGPRFGGSCYYRPIQIKEKDANEDNGKLFHVEVIFEKTVKKAQRTAV